MMPNVMQDEKNKSDGEDVDDDLPPLLEKVDDIKKEMEEEFKEVKQNLNVVELNMSEKSKPTD